MASLSAYFSTSRAYLAAVQSYKAAPLRTPVNDVTALAAALLKHEFAPATITVKINPDKAVFEALVKAMQSEIGSNDRVLFYFAGHGVAQESTAQPKGFLLPADASMTNGENFIDLRWLMQEFSPLPCRHFLLILDCCFAGTVRWADAYRQIGLEDVRILYRENFERFIGDRSWQVITSSSDNEKALDFAVNIGFRGTENSRLSPFALALVRILDGRGANSNRFPDGIITATRLYDALEQDLAAFVQQNAPEHQQSPGYFLLQKHRKGQFVFLEPGRHNPIASLPPRPVNQNPYKGLDAYGETDSPLFFGRQEIIRELTDIIGNPSTRNLVVTGASGIGKTSLMQAGVKPALTTSFSAFLISRPSEIRSKPSLYHDVLPTENDMPFVFFLDQGEELVTVCTEAEKAQWITFLQTLRQQYPRTKIIVGIRNDFETEILDLLGSLLAQRERYVVPPLQRPQIKDVIVKPAAQMAVEIVAKDGTPESTADFIDKTVDEALQSPGSLPLLSFALEKWFDASVKKADEYWILAEKTFWELGGMNGALRNIMKDLVKGLKLFEKDVLLNLLGRMVSVKENNFARQKIYEEELHYTDPEKRRIAEGLIERMIRLRIVVTNRNEAARIEKVYYEPAHDAVISAWPQLLHWLNKRRDKLQVYQRLAEDVQRWKDIPARQKQNHLWQGADLRTVALEIKPQREQQTALLMKNTVVTTFSLGRYPPVEEHKTSFLNEGESDFVSRSIRRIRRRQSWLNLSILAVLVAAVATTIIFSKQEKTNQALFINSTAEGNSPSEKLLLLQKAFELDPDQEVTKQNILQLLNLSPSYYAPFASHILYHRGSFGRTLIPDNDKGELLTVADSSLIWWNANKDVRLRLSDSDVITSAGFVKGSLQTIFYSTFGGRFKIVNRHGEVINQNELLPAGTFTKTFRNRSLHAVHFIDSLQRFLLLSTPRSNNTTPVIFFNTLDKQGNVLRHDTVRTQGLATFISFINEHTAEAYLYDSQRLLIYNCTTAAVRHYQLTKPPPKSPLGKEEVVDLGKTHWPEANEFPVFKFSADGKAFFYKPYKDSVYLLTLNGNGAVFQKLSSSISNAAFMGSGHRLLAADAEGLKILNSDGTVAATTGFARDLFKLEASQDGRLFLAEGRGGTIYLLDEDLKQRLTIDKSYAADGALIGKDNKTLYLISRNTAFYLFDLERKDYLFSGTGYSNVIALPTYASFITWSDDKNAVDIIGPSGHITTVATDTSVLHVIPTVSDDSIFLLTLNSFFLLDKNGKRLLQKPFPAYNLQQGAVLLPSDFFVLYYDSVARLVSPDLKQNTAHKMSGRVRDVVAALDDGFIVLLSNGELAHYSASFAPHWKFRNPRLAVNYFGDKIYSSPPFIYKFNTAGEFVHFDTTGSFKGSGTLNKGTTWPGGNFYINPFLSAYLFSPPDTYIGSSSAVYEHGLYDMKGNRLFTYRFDKPYSGQILDEDKVLFQGTGNGALFTQFTPSGGLKKFGTMKIRVSYSDR